TFSFASRETLGAFNDKESLTEAVRARLHERLSTDHTKDAAPASTSSQSAGNSSAVAPACAVPGPPTEVGELYAATAVLEGRAVQIDVFSLTDDTLTVVVTDVTSCTQLFSQSG